MTSQGNSDELALLNDSVETYCSRALQLPRLRKLRADQRAFDRAIWSEMAELGWTALALPEARGGLALGSRGIASICRQLGRVVAPEPFLESAVACAGILAQCDEDDVRIAELLSGEAVFSCPLSAAAWASETALGASVSGRGFSLSGVLRHVPLAPDVDRILLPARISNELAIFDVSVSAVAAEVTAYTLADGSRDGDIAFADAYVEAGQLVGYVRDRQIFEREVANATDIGASAYLLGLAEALFDMTVEYVSIRKQFGRAVGSFQAIQHRLVDLYTQIRLSAAALTQAIEEAENVALASPTATRALSRACATAQSTAREAIQMHGAIGYTEQCDVALYAQRALVMIARFKRGNAALAKLAHGAADSPVAQNASNLAAIRSVAAMPPGSDWNALADEDFRSGVRDWIEHNYPPELRHYPTQVRWADIKPWHTALVERGWAAPAWPREHGGMGLEPAKMLIFIEELERHGVTRAPDQGILMVGPILMEYGTDEQRARFMHAALTGEHIWCQGYSEPNAGSDLASLTTSALKDGDEFIVNGQKTWTSHASDATHMFCLARTNTQVKPQAGISFLLIDLDQPGVTVRPIYNLGGHIDFCEVFLDNVRVPSANLVGDVDQGWTIAKALLGHERLFVGSPKLCQHALMQLRDLGQATGLMDDAVFRDTLTRITLDVLDLEALYSEYAELVKASEPLGADVAILKIWATETYVRLSELILDAAGHAGAIKGKRDFNGIEIDVLAHYYNARPAPIYAGSNEIQRNIVAKHILKLPT